MKHGLFALSAAVAAAAFTANTAAQVFVDEDFNSYATQAALDAAWRPSAGNGVDPSATPSVGELIPTTNTTGFPAPYDSPPLLDGQGLGGIAGGGVNESVAVFDIAPTATENVVVRGDIFTDGAIGNWRHTIGLRNDTIDRDPNTFGPQLGLNLLEMGFWNADTCDPTAAGCVPGDQNEADPFFIPTTGFGIRLTLFQFGTLGKFFENGVEVGDLLVTPEYQYFQLDPAIDDSTTVGFSGNDDGIADVTDVGEGWHTYTATISETSILFELDLFRDGINNVTNSAGPDASLEYEIQLAEDPANAGTVAGFTSLRLGGPSGVTGNNPVVYDNVFLALEGAPAPVVGDYNGNGVVDAADYTIWRDTDGSTTDLRADGNGDLVVDGSDYTVWANAFGNAASSAVAVPEPGAAALVALALTAVGVRRRG